MIKNQILAAVIVSSGVTGLSLLAVGCASEPDEPPSPAAVQLDQAGGVEQDVDITFHAEPDPPRTGENLFEVVVAQADGTPVTDVEVSAVFYMAAMPSIKMPEMQNRTTLTHQGEGRYQGTGQVMMAGDWDVTVTATRGGEEVGRVVMTVTAQ